MAVIQPHLELRRGSQARSRVGMCLLPVKHSWEECTVRRARLGCGEHQPVEVVVEGEASETETEHPEMRGKVSRKREVNSVKHRRKVK